MEEEKTYFSVGANSPGCIDLIGVPRGIPDEQKLVGEGAAGFEFMVDD